MAKRYALSSVFSEPWKVDRIQTGDFRSHRVLLTTYYYLYTRATLLHFFINSSQKLQPQDEPAASRTLGPYAASNPYELQFGYSGAVRNGTTTASSSRTLTSSRPQKRDKFDTQTLLISRHSSYFREIINLRCASTCTAGRKTSPRVWMFVTEREDTEAVWTRGGGDRGALIQGVMSDLPLP